MNQAARRITSITGGVFTERVKGEYVIKSLTGGGYDLSTLNTEYAPHLGYSDVYPSCVLLSDGRVLCMYSRGSVLYQAFADSLGLFISANSTLEDETAVLSNLTAPRAAVFWGNDGNLYFIVTYKSSTAGGNVAKTLVYKSTLKDGSDWSLFSTIQSVSWGGSSSSLNTAYISVGLPRYFNGVWVVTLPYYTLPSGTILGGEPAIYTTTDFSTFTKRFSSSRWYAWNYGYPQSRNIAELNGELWWTYYYKYTSAIRDYVKSTNGTSWSTAFSLEVAGNLYSTVFSGTDSVYLFPQDVAATDIDILTAASSPSSHNDFVDSGFNMPKYDRDLVICEIGDIAVLLRGGGLANVVGDTSMCVSSMSQHINLQRVRRHHVIT